MSDPGILNLRIEDSSGAPVTMASVCIVSGPAEWPDIAALSGDDGCVSFTVPTSGIYELQVNAPGFAVIRVPVDTSNSHGFKVVRLR